MNQTTQTQKLKLLSVSQEAGNVKTFRFDPGGLNWLAGQNQGYVLPEAGDTEAENERWFTISSAPSEGTVNISTRVSDSKFKQALDALRPGDEIACHDLGGDFTWEDDQPVVLVAGGIGVTPYRSMLMERHTAGKSLDAHLVYFNRTDEIPFQAELEQLDQNHPELKVTYVVGEPISVDKIMELAPEAQSRLTYLSGPEPMVETVGADLKAQNVDLKQDWFPGYDRTNY
ncbi:MAG TPA: FAD-dependent oxidoreductase [Candidatus Saccharimonadales bacterium]|nr:FAD-dependent oxidoreductase [Candidatus Saccharimonadales bacterium]